VSNEDPYHIPVLLEESLQGLNLKEGNIVVDATFGGGGHSKLILERLQDGKLLAFDQDEAAVANVPDDPRLIFIPENFRYLKKFLRLHGIAEVDSILADLGVSSHQFDTGERGFSNRFTGTLDMRMDAHMTLNAASILSGYDVMQLQKIFSEYGELRNAKTLARFIVESRMERPFTTTTEFASRIRPLVMGKESRYYAQVFQSLRIAVNDELNALKEFLQQSYEVLKPGGRLVVLSYHSLEDRLVKDFLRSGNFSGDPEQDLYGNRRKFFHLLTKKPIEASAAEQARNPRSRSVKMRIAEKV